MLRYHHFVYERDKTGQTHPVYDCYHLEAARQECKNLQNYTHNGGLFYVVSKVDAIELTRMESFVKLVYDTRQMQREYFGTRDRDTMLKAMAMEKSIDEWIRRWTDYSAAHPGYVIPNEHDRRLFEMVQKWREAMRNWSRHKPKDDYKRGLKEQCQGYEATIDNIINYRLENYREFK